MTNSIEDQNRLDYIHTLPCIACVIIGQSQLLPTEGHHIVDKGYREHSGGHQSTLPLCGWHHRGMCADGMSSVVMRAQYGPSFELEKRTFKIRFGSERELLELLAMAKGVPEEIVRLWRTARLGET